MGSQGEGISAEEEDDKIVDRRVFEFTFNVMGIVELKLKSIASRSLVTPKRAAAITVEYGFQDSRG